MNRCILPVIRPPVGVSVEAPSVVSSVETPVDLAPADLAPAEVPIEDSTGLSDDEFRILMEEALAGCSDAEPVATKPETVELVATEPEATEPVVVKRGRKPKSTQPEPFAS